MLLASVFWTAVCHLSLNWLVHGTSNLLNQVSIEHFGVYFKITNRNAECRWMKRSNVNSSVNQGSASTLNETAVIVDCIY